MSTPRSAPRSVLVIGGGAAGNAATILLRRAGLAVDLIEAKDDWNATAGSGITLQGNALRVLRELGVWEQVKASGFGFGSVGITAPDGTVLHVARDIRTGGDDLPATVGMQRPRLQRVLIQAAARHVEHGRRTCRKVDHLGVHLRVRIEAVGEQRHAEGQRRRGHVHAVAAVLRRHSGSNWRGVEDEVLALRPAVQPEGLAERDDQYLVRRIADGDQVAGQRYQGHRPRTDGHCLCGHA